MILKGKGLTLTEGLDGPYADQCLKVYEETSNFTLWVEKSG